MNKLILSILVTLLAGCAASRLPADVESQIKNVAIVSLVPEKANFAKDGLSIGHQDSKIEMGDRITATIESVAKNRLLAAHPNWNVIAVSYPRSTLIARISSPGTALAYYEENIEKELAELARNNHLDALVVVSSHKTAYGDGVGIVLRIPTLSSDSYAYVHSFVNVKIMGRDGKIIVVSKGQNIPPRPISADRYGIKFNLPDSLPTELIEPLRQEITRHLTSTIEDNFNRLGM